MSAIIFIVALAMLAMVNAAPVQEDKKNLQGLLDVLADQKANQKSTVQAATRDDDASLQALQGLQQQDDNGNQADAQLFGRLVKHFWKANKQQDDDGNQADAQLFGRLVKHFWKANKQQDDDGNQANAQLFGRLVKHFWKANKQQDDDGNQADAQFFGRLVKHFWKANKQQDDNENQAEAQFLGRLVKRFLWQANKQQDDDGSEKVDAQFWGFLARTLVKHAAGHGINYAMKKLG